MSDPDSLREQITDLRREQSGAEDREAAVRDVLQTIARSTFNLEVVLQTVIDQAVRLCHADHGNIARLEDDAYRVAAFTRFDPEYESLVRERVYLPERGTAVGRTVLERRVVHIVDVLDDPEYSLTALQKAGGYRTVLGVPMLREGAAMGAIVVGRKDVAPFSKAEIQLVETFADYVVIAIENVRLFQTVERQRTELARFVPQVASLLSSQEGEQLLASIHRFLGGQRVTRSFVAFE